MFLKKIEIQGFKSFANKTKLIFDQNLTSIVGPNGSGKSNIADAIRWATGEQSQKLLRTKKSDEVIFAGSDKKNRLGMAEVSLFLDNSSHKIPIDFNEVIITRRVYRNGENEYLINKNKVRLLDIQLMLAKANFGEGNYSIVGQGMIDSILNQSAATRKEFFDEATGIKEFQIKKEKSQLKYTNTQENLSKSKMLLNEISPRLKYLTRQVNKLKNRQEFKEKLIDLQKKYYGFIVSNIKNEIKDNEEKLKIIEKTRNDLEKQLLDIDAKINSKEKKDSYASNFVSIQKEYEELNDLKNKLTRDKVIYQGKLSIEFSNTGKNDISWFVNQKNELSDEFKKNESQIIEYKKEVEELNNKLKNKTEEQQNFLNKIKELQDKLENIGEQNKISDDLEVKNRIKKLNLSIKSIIDDFDNIEIDKLKQDLFFISKEVDFIDKSLSQEDKRENNNRSKLQKEFQDYLLNKDSLVNEIYELKSSKNYKDEKLKELIRRQDIISVSISKLDIEIESANSSDKSKNQKQIEDMIANIDDKISNIDNKIANIKLQIDKLESQSHDERKELLELQKTSKDLQFEINKINSEIQEIKISLAKNQTKKENIETEIRHEELDINDLDYNSTDIDTDVEFSKINKLKIQLSQIGEIEESTETEYNEVNEKYIFLDKQITDLDNASNDLKHIIDDLNEKIENKFNENFKKINEIFNEYFQILFGGGSATLTIKKETDKQKENENAAESQTEIIEEETEKNTKTYEGKIKPITDIIITVKIPGKKLNSMNVLSGGERSLTSIALICAIIFNNPSPFVVLDEVDAALDEANSVRFAEIIEKLKDKTQFICITHNRATMTKSDTLYGVTMDESGVSKMLSISFAEAKKYSE
ncbi:MAG TPA: AAA family ATPase [bacterium]|jgi:chromosome segregation protein|nr:AAA family ATPase [bacterium]HOG38556.1 AAA family ATPase [bacterium]HQI03442.1 AAA family ATPase [bacterium]